MSNVLVVGNRLISIAVLALLLLLSTVQAQTSGFSYQGRLLDAGTPANGSYDLQVALFENLTGGPQIGTTLTRASVAVSGGVFTVQLDFGLSAFPGADRFLEISVRAHSADPNTPAYTLLTPRQQINSTPYAIRTLSASAADTATNATQLGGVAAGQYVQTNDVRLTDARTPNPHQATHKDGGTDEIAVAAPAANQIPKAGADSKLAFSWLPVGTTANTVAAGNDSRFTNTTAANYVFAYDTTAQAVATLNTFQDIAFNTNAQINGWTHPTGGSQSKSFTCNQSGLYLIQYSGEGTSTTATTLSARAVLNNTEIDGSQLAIAITTNFAAFPFSRIFIANIASGEILKFQFTGNVAVTQLAPNNGSGTTRPSVSITIIRIQ